MNLHEYQAKRILAACNVPVLPGYLAHTPREAEKGAVNLGAERFVIKAQVHAGGRGKAGGVLLADSTHEARECAEKILGMKLVTAQTGKHGIEVKKVLVEPAVGIAREFYLSLLVDRERRSYCFVISAEGGMEIEEVARKTPGKILKIVVSPESGFQAFHARKAAAFLGLKKEEGREFGALLAALFSAFCRYESQLIEINPLVQTSDGHFLCLDAKMAVDDNALFRQRAAFEYQDYEETDEREIQANQIGLSYVALEGDIGCLVNGAGLAMATADIIQQAGGSPANFLDVGGGASTEMVTEAFKLILQDASVKAVLVNIFGGIMRCDVIAEGIIEAAKSLDIKVPLVVRLRGTNDELGRKLLSESKLSLIPAQDMHEAANKVVAAARGE